MRTLSISAALGILAAILLSLAVISSQSAAELSDDSVLTNYGER